MARLVKLSGTVQQSPGYRVETEAGGSSYEYDFRHVDQGGDDGEVRLVAKRVDGTEVDPTPTEAAVDALPDSVEVVDR